MTYMYTLTIPLMLPLMHILAIIAAMTTPSMLQQAKACMLVLTTHIFKNHDELAVDGIIKK